MGFWFSRIVTTPPLRPPKDSRSGLRVETTNSTAREIVAAWAKISQSLRMEWVSGGSGGQTHGPRPQELELSPDRAVRKRSAGAVSPAYLSGLTRLPALAYTPPLSVSGTSRIFEANEDLFRKAS